jgi:hypothetical protein
MDELAKNDEYTHFGSELLCGRGTLYTLTRADQREIAGYIDKNRCVEID